MHTYYLAATYQAYAHTRARPRIYRPLTMLSYQTVATTRPLAPYLNQRKTWWLRTRAYEAWLSTMLSMFAAWFPRRRSGSHEQADQRLHCCCCCCLLLAQATRMYGSSYPGISYLHRCRIIFSRSVQVAPAPTLKITKPS
ncbi:unnamed protein product [Somion occarium]|uniref:Uncharacterized protein n=1 Tax=Somion occarium TaxID=3059160 RepID=A0ABP1CMC4_9APHY